MTILSTLTGSLGTAFLASSLIFNPTPATSVSEATQPEATELPVIVEQLEDSLEIDAGHGDPVAIESLEALNNLSDEEINQLDDILSGDGIFAAAENQVEGVDIILSHETEDLQEMEDATQAAPMAAASTISRTRSCTSTFKFLGITINQIRLTGTYRVRSGKVIGTTSVSPRVIRTYEPGVLIAFSNSKRSYTSSRANFQTTVTVTRSIFGWNHSTRSSIHRLSANPSGTVTRCGF